MITCCKCQERIDSELMDMGVILQYIESMDLENLETLEAHVRAEIDSRIFDMEEEGDYSYWYYKKAEMAGVF